jgi:hypothetical protein
MFESQSEYENWFESVFKKMTRGIEEHQFIHYNNSMGCHIYGKEHYKLELKRRRMIPYDVMEEVAEDYDKRNPRKEYGELSPKAMDIVKHLKYTADKDGNLRLGQRAIDAMIEIGAISTQSEHRPEGLPVEGGYS